MTNLEKAKSNFLNQEKYLSPYACRSEEVIRLREEEEDLRAPFFHDIDRIIYSLSYTRYMDKTQVFTRSDNDHISKRITHVQLVSKIARTIGRSLNLNCDLIEAIALGHDIGHTPLGHAGEKILNDISKKELNEYFAHNIQSVRNLMCVENKGNGYNISVQVLDGIMCHNGEMLSAKYSPEKKNKEDFLKQYNDSYNDLDKSQKNRPMTLEGCVVRISDIIGYIGRDIEDAIILGKLKREDIPEDIVKVLGDNNKDIIDTIVKDIINNSMDKSYIKMSDSVYKALFALKKFNYKYIYSVSLSKDKLKRYEEGMKRIYNKYLEDIENNNKDSIIYNIFLNSQSKKYLEETNDKRKVIDFIAGMTDELFLKEISK